MSDDEFRDEAAIRIAVEAAGGLLVSRGALEASIEKWAQWSFTLADALTKTRAVGIRARRGVRPGDIPPPSTRPPRSI